MNREPIRQLAARTLWLMPGLMLAGAAGLSGRTVHLESLSAAVVSLLLAGFLLGRRHDR
jgi:hypothetical protein